MRLPHSRKDFRRILKRENQCGAFAQNVLHFLKKEKKKRLKSSKHWYKKCNPCCDDVSYESAGFSGSAHFVFIKTQKNNKKPQKGKRKQQRAKP